MMDDFFPFDDEPAPLLRICDHEGCLQPGEFPAPKSRHNLRDYYYFCLDHVREYNHKWDFFAGFSAEQIYSQVQSDTAWERPTWPTDDTIKVEEKLHEFIRQFTGKKNSSAPPPTKAAVTREAQAYDSLGLAPNVEMKVVKTRYRELVKRYHPDKNPDNPKAVERFKVISEAYSIIQASQQAAIK